MKTTKIVTCLVMLFCAMSLSVTSTPAVQGAAPDVDSAMAAGWGAGHSLPQALAALGAVVTSGHLITFGGQNATGSAGTPVDNVYKSATGSGPLGAWSSGGSLDRPTSSQGVVLADGRVYLIGGRSGSDALKDVRFALVDGSGDVDSWRQTQSLPRKSSLAGTAVSAGVIYVAGGFDGSSVRSEVYYAPIGPGGVLTAWHTANSLPGVRRSLTLTAANGYLYAIGGSDGKIVSAQVHRAKINADGSLGAWQPLGALPQPRERHATVVYGGRLVVLGGLNASAGSTNTVYAAMLNADGSLGAWQTGFLPSLPQPLDRHAAVVANIPGCGDVIYVVGGSNGGACQNTVYYTSCATNPGRTVLSLLIQKKAPVAPGIDGRILQMGAGVAGVAVHLNFFDGDQWTQLRQVDTNSNGNYFFSSVPPLGAGQMYGVSFENMENNNTRLARAQSFAITAYPGGRISGGDLEVQNVYHTSPADGATVGFPATFCWQTRGLSGDAYYLVLLDAAQEMYWFAAGSENCLQLDDLPTGFQYGQAYPWSIGVVNQPVDSYDWGVAPFDREVTFQATTLPKAGFWQNTNGDTEFYVPADQAHVDDFAIYVNVEGCGSYKITHTLSEPITDGQFSFTGAFYADGAFSSSTVCATTSGLDQFDIPGCGTVSGGPWTDTETWQYASAASEAVDANVVAVEPVESSASNRFLTAHRVSQ
jgi:hypothetical protein